ncbi:ligand-binding sensor domain-containing protein/signal transduction histidine kinase/DNA-binding NarL/FixJ family response regulator [Dyadobacter sp. BE34]|uniref:histidine kinase n=1 Tax=Dyadobacter fermentans TaxID=94254 RepID=A0ABU1QVI4_9BACT|nr:MULTISPECIES: two-component regulator propeller domain-containing protein [Dyadobacter]MDR6805168.1 ligand-binding sensor domain-containing protein/signal transduction histidine kinase/DNA-binding NarL/FixJ family response regulator [Dyadobacter fermentans]MDR7043073.1 ligand-binding sensor domain-containing protein/signal transduction histidine kinase/DNA-binding NarL/FixJ family response regulator [Dyadobacter sp. BE242]MDR7197385.1 ligand-binding sensor domain-containing protein/signal tra
MSEKRVMRVLKRIFSNLLTLSLCCIALAGYAADNAAGRVLRYSIREGLSFGVVNSIAQDNDGLMWFATGDGVSRFDGTAFKNFKYDRNDPHSLPGNYVKSIVRDKNGTIWVSSRDGIAEFVPASQHFNRYKPFQNKSGAGNDVSDISQGQGDRLWLALNGSGFASFNTKTHQFTHHNQQTLPGLFTNSILNVFEDSQGMIWLGSRDSGIEVWKYGASGRLVKAGVDTGNVPASRINAIYEDHLRNVWIASSRGLILFKRAENRFYDLHINTFHHSDIYLSLVEDRQQNLLIGVQDGGVYRLALSQMAVRSPDALVFEQVRDKDNKGVTQRSVQSLYIDKDRNVWLGTYGEGTYLISAIPEKFRKFEQKTIDSRAESYLRYYGMCADKEGNLWLGTDGDGIYKTTASGEVLKHYAASAQPGQLPDGAVIAAHRDRQDRLWFGTYSKGLVRYDPATDSFKRYAADPSDPHSLGKNDVRVIYQDRRRNIWVGTNGGGLSLLDERTGRFRNFIPSNSSINANDVRAITEDRYGNLWIGTYGGGLNYLNTRTMQFVPWFNAAGKEPYLSNRIVFSLYMDGLDRLWIGSEGNGLLLFDTRAKNVRFFDEKRGLASNVINAIQPESLDKVWISTNKGLSRIDLKMGSIENFDTSHGLQGGQFNPGSALLNAKSGLMSFGGTEGWNLFDPKQVRASHYQPKVMISGIRIFGKDKENEAISLFEYLGKQRRFSIKPDQPVFSIDYTALNYAYPELTRYAYMLEGLDKDWNYVENERSATYRYLPSGNYEFKVKVANQDGIWFEDYASLPIRVMPPWYYSWWAYLLYILTIGLVLYYYQQYKLGQEKMKYDVQLAQMETRQQMELNEKKLSFFTNVSHEFRTPLTLIINPIREMMQSAVGADVPSVSPSADGSSAATANMHIIYRNAKRLLSLVDQLLLFRKADQQTDQLKPAAHNFQQLVTEVFQCFLHQAEQKHIHYELALPETELEVVCDWEKTEIAIFNLISNALKFTPEHGTVHVQVNDLAEQVEIVVSDTGPGIPTDAGEDIFKVFHQYADRRFAAKGGFGIGLYLAKTFVENHFGRLRYESELDHGTTFHVLLWKAHPDLVSYARGSETRGSVLLEELSEGVMPVKAPAFPDWQSELLDMKEPSTESHTMLVVDDDPEIRQYLSSIFSGKYKMFDAGSGEEGLELVRNHLPDIVISDVMMGGTSGIELCRQMKLDMALSHIPVILLTASTSQDVRLKGIEGGADDYISKPFDKDILVARVASILRNRNDLQRYFYNEITLQTSDFKISVEYKEFLTECIRIVENHITDSGFNVKVLAAEIGMSHSTLYNRIKSISGQSATSFVRFIRLRKAAQLLITTDITISETAFSVGINDIRYFREHFQKLFGMKPSDYVKKFRKPFHERSTIDKDLFRKKSV